VRDVNEAERNPIGAGLERFVGLEHIESDNLHLKQWGLLADSAISFTKRFRKGQILFGKRRAYQRKVAVAGFDGICSSDILTFEPKDDSLLSELLPFIVQSDAFFEHALGTSSGSLSPRTRWSQLQDYEFPLPPKEEQRHIAETLWAMEMAITNVNRAIDEARLLRSLSFHELQSQNVNAQSLSTIGDAISSIVAGYSPKGSSEPALSHEFGVLKVSAVGHFGFCENENKALLDPQDFVPELEVRPGFLLVTRANALLSGIGRACIVQHTRRGLMLSDKTLRLVENPSRVRPRFLLEALRSRCCRNFIEGAANGTEAKNISQERLRQAPIWLPELVVQDRVLQVVSTADHAINDLKEHVKRLRGLKRCFGNSVLRGVHFNVH
jgi:type I restriction enzyme S subunit